MSVLGKQIGEPVAKQLLHTTNDTGINFFANAEAYVDGQAEIEMRAILKKATWSRRLFLVSSRVFLDNV